MLVLSRKKNESIIVNDNISIKLLRTKFNLATFEIKQPDKLKNIEGSVDQYFYITKDIKLSIVEITKDRVKLGIDAPKQVSIFREEILERIKSKKELVDN